MWGRKTKEPRAFRPHEMGLRKVLGGLESAIMEVVWELGEGSVRGVLERFKGRNPAYETVKTVMDRMAQKGYLARRKEGKAFVYRATESREAFWQRVRSEVLKGAFEREDLMLAHFVQMVGEDEANLDRLRDLVEKERKRRGGREA